MQSYLSGGAESGDKTIYPAAEQLIMFLPLHSPLSPPLPPSLPSEVKPFSVWWSRHRLDYLLESPLAAGGSESLPATAITHVIHSSYWEAKEVISFILRQVLYTHRSTCYL